jgi:hypothetical protein
VTLSTIFVKEAVLNVASSMRWVKETQGANRGEAVDRMIRATGLVPPQPWCMAYVNWCGQAALDLLWPLPMAAGCQFVAEAAQKLGMLKVLEVGVVPERGSIFLLWGESVHRYRHTGFVLGADAESGWYRCIEGNTNDDGSPEGTGVFKRRRQFTGKDAIINWWL